MLDIDASFEERSTTIETVKSIASKVFIPFTVGGGIKSLKDIDMLLKSGADKVSINTSAILNPDLYRGGFQRVWSSMYCFSYRCQTRWGNLERLYSRWKKQNRIRCY